MHKKIITLFERRKKCRNDDRFEPRDALKPLSWQQKASGNENLQERASLIPERRRQLRFHDSHSPTSSPDKQMPLGAFHMERGFIVLAPEECALLDIDPEQETGVVLSLGLQKAGGIIASPRIRGVWECRERVVVFVSIKHRSAVSDSTNTTSPASPPLSHVCPFRVVVCPLLPSKPVQVCIAAANEEEVRVLDTLSLLDADLDMSSIHKTLVSHITNARNWWYSCMRVRTIRTSKISDKAGALRSPSDLSRLILSFASHLVNAVNTGDDIVDPDVDHGLLSELSSDEEDLSDMSGRSLSYSDESCSSLSVPSLLVHPSPNNSPSQESSLVLSTMPKMKFLASWFLRGKKTAKILKRDSTLRPEDAVRQTQRYFRYPSFWAGARYLPAYRRQLCGLSRGNTSVFLMERGFVVLTRTELRKMGLDPNRHSMVCISMGIFPHPRFRVRVRSVWDCPDRVEVLLSEIVMSDADTDEDGRQRRGSLSPLYCPWNAFVCDKLDKPVVVRAVSDAGETMQWYPLLNADINLLPHTDAVLHSLKKQTGVQAHGLARVGRPRGVEFLSLDHIARAVVSYIDPVARSPYEAWDAHFQFLPAPSPRATSASADAADRVNPCKLDVMEPTAGPQGCHGETRSPSHGLSHTRLRSTYSFSEGGECGELSVCSSVYSRCPTEGGGCGELSVCSSVYSRCPTEGGGCGDMLYPVTAFPTPMVNPDPDPVQCLSEIFDRLLLDVEELVCQSSNDAEKSFKCAHCEKTFARKYNRKVHERSHTGEKPFWCETCEKGFSTKQVLLRHIRTVHTDEKPYHCQCGQRFHRRDRMIAHQKTHDQGPGSQKRLSRTVSPKMTKSGIQSKPKPRMVHACAVCGLRFASVIDRDHHTHKEHVDPLPALLAPLSPMSSASSSPPSPLLHTDESDISSMGSLNSPGLMPMTAPIPSLIPMPSLSPPPLQQLSTEELWSFLSPEFQSLANVAPGELQLLPAAPRIDGFNHGVFSSADPFLSCADLDQLQSFSSLSPHGLLPSLSPPNVNPYAGLAPQPNALLDPMHFVSNSVDLFAGTDKEALRRALLEI